MTPPDDQSPPSPDEATARAHLAEVLADMRAVLAVDLVAWPAREARKRFCAGGDHAAALDDGAVATLKRAVEAAGRDTAVAVLAALADDALWLDPGATPPADAPRSLEGHGAVTTQLQRVEAALRAAFEEAGFPQAACDFRYRTPTWFIEGRYMPGLIETFWRRLAVYRAARQAGDRQRAARRGDSLGKRWDDA